MTPIAEFSNYEELRKALVAAKNLRNVSFVTLDEISGAPSGYFSHALGPRPQKRMSVNPLLWALGALGLKGALLEDPEALARVQSRLLGRNLSQVRYRHHAEG